MTQKIDALATLFQALGDPTRLRKATGWEPRIPIERTLKDLLQSFRERERMKGAVV